MRNGSPQTSFGGRGAPLNEKAFHHFRQLTKSELGGVIFGCNNCTIAECLSKQLFGLPASHISYVKNIEPGLPLFLFNYSDRKLYGIFEATSSGQMYIDPYGWTMDGSEKTQFPAQVRVCLRTRCQPLAETQFGPVLVNNFHNQNKFWFELDRIQVQCLTQLFRLLPECNLSCQPSFDKSHSFDVLQNAKQHSSKTSGHDDKADGVFDVAGEFCIGHVNEVAWVAGNKPLVVNYGKDGSLKEDGDVGSSQVGPSALVDKSECLTTSQLSTESMLTAFDPSCTNEWSVESKDAPDFVRKQFQIYKVMEKRLVEAEMEIKKLKDKICDLEAKSMQPMRDAGEILKEPVKDDLSLLKEAIFLIGGYDGISWLPLLDLYLPCKDVVTSCSPMGNFHSCASAAALNDSIYVFGGGKDDTWFDTVERYEPSKDRWRPCPPLLKRTGSLAGLALHNKLFAVGGGNGVECFSDVEMFDPFLGRWIMFHPMLQKRFALAATELNGVIYAVGGFDGKDYLQSVERFDLRVPSWIKLPNMNVKRGCHSVTVLDEKMPNADLDQASKVISNHIPPRKILGKENYNGDTFKYCGLRKVCLAGVKCENMTYHGEETLSGDLDHKYAIGGYDGTRIVSSVEMFDPRMGMWEMVSPLQTPRGYAGCAVLGNTIYVIGGVEDAANIVETVECYKFGRSWELTGAKAVGKRSFFSAIVL